MGRSDEKCPLRSSLRSHIPILNESAEDGPSLLCWTTGICLLTLRMCSTSASFISKSPFSDMDYVWSSEPFVTRKSYLGDNSFLMRWLSVNRFYSPQAEHDNHPTKNRDYVLEVNVSGWNHT